jgi:exonuclease III
MASVISVNVNGCFDKRNEIFNKLKRLRCEIACLQEVHEIPDGFKAWVMRNYGFHLHYYSQKHAGTAIVTREAVERENVVPPTLQGRLTHIVLKSGTHVLSVYVPTQNQAHYRIAIEFFENLKRYERK